MNDTAANPVSTPLTLALRLRQLSISRIRVLAWAPLTGAFLFSALWGIGSFGIQDNNEGVYAEVAREMNVTGDWIIPHLNGAPYLDKPPLLYWIEAALLHVFGVHAWAVRLGPVLCFAGTLAAVTWIGRQIRDTPLGRGAALLLCSAAGVVGMSRSLLFDAPLTCALAWSLACFLRWRLTGSRTSLRVAYALLGAGVMAKGLVALALGGGTFAIATFLARRSWRDVATLADPAGLAWLAAVVVPWHVLATLREPAFAHYYFINEQFNRFLGAREPHDFYTGPLYYYVIRAPLYLGVWAFLLPVLAGPRASATPVGAAEPEGRRLFATFAILGIAFFSVSEAKANYYLLPIMPAVALLVVQAWPREGVVRRRLMAGAAGTVGFAVAFAVSPFVFARKPGIAPLIEPAHPLLAVVAVTLVGLGFAITASARAGRNGAAFRATVAAGLVVLLPLPSLLRRADGLLSQRALAHFLTAEGDRPIVLFREYESLSSLVFYRGEPVPVVDSWSNELTFAHDHAGDSPTFMSAAAAQAFARQRPLWVVTTPRQVDDALRCFDAESAHVVGRFPRAVVLAVGKPAGMAAAREPAKPAPGRSPRSRAPL